MSRPASDPRPSSVYVMFTHDLYPLYVGITGVGRERFHQHAGDKFWWPEVSHIRVFFFLVRQDALDVEAYLIALLDPEHNGPQYGDPVRGRKVFQDAYPDCMALPDIDLMEVAP